MTKIAKRSDKPGAVYWFRYTDEHGERRRVREGWNRGERCVFGTNQEASRAGIEPATCDLEDRCSIR